MVYFGQKKPEFTDHALKRMEKRGVTREEVEFVLNNPEYTTPGECGTVKIMAHTNGKRVKIMVSEANGTRIITVAADEEAK